MTEMLEIAVITAQDVAERESMAVVWHEIVAGEWLEEMSVPTQIHNLVAKRILRQLDNFVSENNLGEVYGDGMNFVLQGTARKIEVMRIPDVAFVAEARVNRRSQDYYYFAPDLAVEIASESELDHPKRLNDKIEDYLAFGTRQVWVIYPDEKKVVVYLPEGSTATYTDKVPAGDLLAGFELDLQRVFADL